VSHHLHRGRFALPALLLALAALAALAIASPAAHANGSLSGGIDSQLAFGTDASGNAEANTDAAAGDLGAQTMRVHFQWSGSVPESQRSTCAVPTPRGTSWADPASYDFSRPLRILANARRREMRVFLQITAPFPCWASKDGNTSANRCVGSASPSTCSWRPSLTHYRNFLRAVLKATGGVNRISLYNEPNHTDFLTGADIYERALIYRDIWFTGREILRGDYHRPDLEPSEFPHLASIPLWYGEMAQSDNEETFLKTAFCFDGAMTPDPDPHYEPCDGDDLPVTSASGAEALTFHTYLADNSPQENLRHMSKLRRIWSEIRNKENAVQVKIGAPAYFVITEAGVHHGQSYDYVTPTGTVEKHTDPRGTGRTPAVQAAYVNCLEHNMFRDPRVVGIVQYILQDSPAPRTERVFTGLRYRDGSAKPSYAAWRMPLTVYRPDGAASTNLRVWGAYRRLTQGARPTSVTLVGLNGGVPFERTIPLDPATYPNGHFITTLDNVPTSITRFQIRADGLSSREATPTDCDQAGDPWNGGVPIDFNTTP
jgi:hypothetical protein